MMVMTSYYLHHLGLNRDNDGDDDDDDDGDIHHDGDDAYVEILPPSSQSEPGQIETLRQQQQCARAGSGRPVPLQIVVEGQDDQNGQENQDG